MLRSLFQRNSVRLLLLAALVPSTSIQHAVAQEAKAHFENSVRPVLVKYCAACHENGDDEDAVLFLKAKTVDDLANDRSHWKSVAEQLCNRTMPPADKPQPTEEERLRISTWIEKVLRQTACNGYEYAGSVTTRRLNRTEYDNTMRDLLGLERSFAQKFPVDGSGGEGFDNNGETLFLPPLLLERYLEAATEAINECVIVPRERLFLRPKSFQSEFADLEQNRTNVEKLALDEGDRISTLVRILHGGEYTVAVHINRVAGEAGKVEFCVDNIRAHLFVVPPAGPADNAAGKSDVADVRVSTRLRFSAGYHKLDLNVSGDSPVEFVRLDIAEDKRNLSEADRIRHRRLVGISPGNSVKEPRQAAIAAIRILATRAFRRPAADREILPFLDLFDRAHMRGDPFEDSLKQSLRAVLVSPYFIFRIENPAESETPEPISDYELASRLSYFLWSSMPDDRLFRLASEGRLHQNDVLTDEVNRMLRDEKSEAFCYEFIGQWLGTIEVAASIVPDTGKFKGQFNTELLMDFRDEPVRLFQYIVQNDRSVLELLDPGYAVVNERLSKHYQLNGEPPPRKRSEQTWSANPKRSKAGTFERVNLKDNLRGGVLGMGGVHLLTSYPTRTSPVLRGGWVLETLLGVRVPSPPPDVPELKTSKEKKKLTAKESLALHRDNAACATCHNLMDPVGFALENYDVLGRWREKDGREKIDVTAALPSGEKFTGLDGLRTVLMSRKDDFVRQLTEKILGYALGRSLNDSDDCTVQRIADAVRNSDYRAKTLISEVVLSVPFQKHQLVEE